MADEDYAMFHYSITCETDDLAILHFLRALCEFAERQHPYPQIGWCGTGQDEWWGAGNRIALRFMASENRDAFVRAAHELLPESSWSEVRRSDHDPAERQTTEI